MKTGAGSTVGSVSTLSLCGSDGAHATDADPWIHADPWGAYNRPKAQPVQLPTDGVQQLQERIQSAVLAKIPTAMDDDMPDRLTALEGQVHMLMTQHQTLDSKMNEFSSSNAQQFTMVQQQIQQQGNSFHGQLESHAQGIQAMFTQQMEQIRGLLAKRPRDDTME